MDSSILSLASVTIAVAAVAVATWQARINARSAERAARSAERTHTLPVISETFREFRSAEFRTRVSYLTAKLPREARAARGFSSLPKKWREDAYEVCYYFDYLGVLVNFGIIREELVISLWGTTIMQVWLAAEPLISRERAHRRITYSAGISPGFLVYYEDLVCRIMARGGRDAARQIQEQSGLRQLNEPLNKLTVRSDKVLNA
jgi:hypothetical protein